MTVYALLLWPLAVLLVVALVEAALAEANGHGRSPSHLGRDGRAFWDRSF